VLIQATAVLVLAACSHCSLVNVYVHTPTIAPSPAVVVVVEVLVPNSGVTFGNFTTSSRFIFNQHQHRVDDAGLPGPAGSKVFTDVGTC
jgi:hypothetical protein